MPATSQAAPTVLICESNFLKLLEYFHVRFLSMCLDQAHRKSKKKVRKINKKECRNNVVRYCTACASLCGLGVGLVFMYS
jgi:hypothetical protein